MKLNDKVVTVGVTSSIAAYKACEIVSLLKKEGADVHVVMTKNAVQFVAPLTFETLSNNRVIVDMFDRHFEYEVEHISLAKKSDCFLIAPCTANFAGKLANGIADDFLSTTVMATKAPVILAPAMNTGMLNSAAYLKNAQVLKERGVYFIQSQNGLLACGDVGDGRLAAPNEIVDYVSQLLCEQNDYLGKTVLITAGATIEPIDPVRYISNYSSGKMGLAIAENAYKRGANVILVAGNLTQSVAPYFKTIKVKTTNQMYDEVMKQLPGADIIIKAAAPSDYSVESVSEQKIKAQKLTLNLKKNPDIAKAVGQEKGNKILVIFSAETENLVENASKKLQTKNADMVVANDVTQEGAGFNVDTNIATIITHKNIKELPIMKKIDLADVILDEVLDL